jgi:hypothetical protein
MYFHPLPQPRTWVYAAIATGVGMILFDALARPQGQRGFG